MKDPHFSYFVEKFGEANHRTQVPEEDCVRWTGKLPLLLLNIWGNEGWASYGAGRIWIVNPDDYEDIKNAWLEDTPLAVLDSFHVVARSSFGDLYLCGEKTGRSVTIACLHNEILALKSNLKPSTPQVQDFSIQSFFGSREPHDFDYKDIKGKLLFDRAVKKNGPLAPDEMFGFEPALVLGGSVTLENLRRLKLIPYLHILRKLNTPTLPFSSVDFEKLMK